MCIVIVIGTAHFEDGASATGELYKIIEKISPDVVFCEASQQKLPKMLENTDVITPEVNTIKRLIKEKSIEIVPIDVNEDPFDNRLEAMFSLFKKKMKVYSNASNMLSNETYLKGYTFLNSMGSDKIFRDINSMEKYFLDTVKNKELSEYHSKWMNWNDLRENQWINLIHNYSKINKPNKAVFLVGAGHRYRLIDKIKNIHNNNEHSFDWDFFPFK
ncbi:TraB/GumN family protein [Flavivirga rizhaonensis]|uniref:TraB/GumN family protein n=1 Tax=Flavivirga rizhaonensis TaxID=2559571 RepID=A0A4S1DRP4_9FLAO|nr:hypothetical protein [Flavivirga rizhaonensis]TGV00581.1 hypothetical protein EM932_19165 [Flavivirga rizhaonensis]